MPAPYKKANNPKKARVEREPSSRESLAMRTWCLLTFGLLLIALGCGSAAAQQSPMALPDVTVTAPRDPNETYRLRPSVVGDPAA